MANGNDDPRKNKKQTDTIRSAWGKTKDATHDTTADWATADPHAMQRLISLVTARGALISFGYSRDGGAYLVSVIENEAKHKEWIPANTDVSLALDLLCEALGG